MSEDRKTDRPERMSDSQFEELYTQYATDVLRVSYFYLGNRQQAEDVTQDVFVRLITSSPKLEAGSEKAWLLKVAVNRCRDLWRSSWMKRVVLGSPALELTPDPEHVDDRLMRQDLLQAVHSLAPVLRETVLLFYYQGYSTAEIAEMLSLPEGTVSSRLNRARKKLQEILKEGDA